MQKKLQLFHFEGCPYCKATRRWIESVKREHPELASVDIEMIDEKLHPEIAEQYDYYYVPTFFLDGRKVHEGPCKKEIVERVLRDAL